MVCWFRYVNFFGTAVARHFVGCFSLLLQAIGVILSWWRFLVGYNDHYHALS